MHNYKELKIWQKARHLVKNCYAITLLMPKEEKFGLTSQIQRAVVSIPANIAEGSGKSSPKDFCRFLEIALSSAFELETLILVTCDLEFLKDESSNVLISDIQELQKMIYSFKKTIQDKNNEN
jgi:four helix bundle protein